MRNVRSGRAFAMALALGLSLVACNVMAAKPIAEPTAKAAVKPKPPKKMMINGISSGVLRLPLVTVWECPGGAMGGCNPVGELKHGTQVLRHKLEKARGHKWGFITTDGMEGWVRKELLKNAGT